jgi:4-amino-4-deoxy-L-arabinose transferase-like glycosyltransferase
VTRRHRATETGLLTHRPEFYVALLGFVVVFLAGLALRLIYLLRASPFVDEYSTLMAAQGILAGGVPLLPSGFFYGHDPLYSYVAAGAALLWSDDLLAVRTLSLLASLAAVALSYRMGRRLVSPLAGLLAAAFLALSPEAVLWGARARAYALEQFLALLAFWLFYQGVDQDRVWWRRLGLLVLVAAVFTHPEAALLLPGLALAVLALRGLRWWLHLDRFVEFALAGVGVIARYLLQNAVAGGDVGGFEAIANARPTFGFLANWQGGLETLRSFLLAGPMLPATLSALVAILAVILRRDKDKRAYAVAFLAITLGAILLQMALVIGGTWQSVRYLIFAFPFLFLLAGAGLDELAARLAPRLRREALWASLALAMVVVLLPSIPKAVRAANTAEIAYDRAFEYVGQHWGGGDRLATLAPAAAWIGLGRVDYFALGRTYEEFVWQKDGQWYDKWIGVPLIHTAPELATVLDQAEAAGTTLWFVTDESRLLQRYEADFVQMVWDRMVLVYASGRAQVFRSQPARAYALEVSSPRRETFAGQIALAGYAIGDPNQAGSPPGGALVVQPGQSLPLRLDWQALAPLTDTYTVFVHLVDASGGGCGQSDGLPLAGLYPMHLWEPGIRYPDARTLDLATDLAPGRCRLEVGLYQLASGDRLPVTEGLGRLPTNALVLDYVTVPGGEPPRAPDVRLDAELGSAIRLLGVSPDPSAAVVHPGDVLALTLYWQVERPTAENETLFVHLVGADGPPLTQYDGQPQGGFYPTAFWDAGERLEDRITLVVPDDAAPGTYRLLAGFYLLATEERLPVTGADAAPGSAVLLGQIVVER